MVDLYWKVRLEDFTGYNILLNAKCYDPVCIASLEKKLEHDTNLMLQFC